MTMPDQDPPEPLGGNVVAFRLVLSLIALGIGVAAAVVVIMLVRGVI
jgi:hypothetical protein